MSSDAQHAILNMFLQRLNTAVVALVSKCFGQATLDPGITAAHSIKIALRIVGMHGGDPSSATTTSTNTSSSLLIER